MHGSFSKSRRLDYVNKPPNLSSNSFIYKFFNHSRLTALDVGDRRLPAVWLGAAHDRPHFVAHTALARQARGLARVCIRSL